MLKPYTWDMGESVLLSIEDSDTEFYLIEMAVKKANLPIRLHRVEDGEQGLAFLQRWAPYQDAPRPDLIMLNLNLPRKNGFEVLADLQGIESLRSIPVIVFTSSSHPAEKDRALALGAQDYVVKPPTLDALVDAVTTICSRVRGSETA
ncbi:MAG: response regulator [Bryobacteraceae bacterium]